MLLRLADVTAATESTRLNGAADPTEQEHSATLVGCTMPNWSGSGRWSRGRCDPRASNNFGATEIPNKVPDLVTTHHDLRHNFHPHHDGVKDYIRRQHPRHPKVGWASHAHSHNKPTRTRNQRSKKECELYTTHDLRPAPNVIGHRSVLSLYPNGHNLSPPLFTLAGLSQPIYYYYHQSICIYPRISGDNRERFTGITGMALFWRYICLWLPSIYFHRRGDIAFSYIRGGVWTSQLSLNMVVYAASQENTSWKHRRENAKEEERSKPRVANKRGDCLAFLVKMGKIEKRTRCAWVQEWMDGQNGRG